MVAARPRFNGRPVASDRAPNLALLIDAEHQRAIRRVEVEPDDVGDFLLELRVVRDLKPL
jgi:hypothetical protein